MCRPRYQVCLAKHVGSESGESLAEAFYIPVRVAFHSIPQSKGNDTISQRLHRPRLDYLQSTTNCSTDSFPQQHTLDPSHLHFATKPQRLSHHQHLRHNRGTPGSWQDSQPIIETVIVVITPTPTRAATMAPAPLSAPAATL